MRKFSKSALIATAAFGVLSGGGSANAQSAKPEKAGSGQTDGTQIGDIVVTANKRSESVQRTPLSIAAISGDVLQARGIQNTEQLGQTTPGLLIQRQVVTKVVVRGVGSENFTIGGDPGVAIHSDGVYVARSSVALFDMFDVERVEVLRGPQGTLYGRNATGGVINLISNQPKYETAATVIGEYGNYNKVRLEAAVNIPLVNDKIALRVSGLRATRDGYTINVNADAISRGYRQLDNQDLSAIRGLLRVDPSSGLRIDLKADYYLDKSNPAPNFFPIPPLPQLGGENPPQPTSGSPRFVDQGFELFVPVLGRSVDRAGGSRQISFSAKLSDDMGWATFSSLSAYRNTRFNWWNEGDGVSVSGVWFFQEDHSRQFTQEFQLTSPKSDKLEWLLGAYYFNEHSRTFAAIPLNFLTGVVPDPNILSDATVHPEGFAFFGQGTYKFGSGLSLTAGLRYNNEKKDFTNRYDRLGTITLQDISRRWTALTPKFSLQYEPRRGALLYVSATRGFKSGGFNNLAVQDAYNPETLWSYEAGLKSDLLDHHLRLNGSAFYYKYNDLQINKVQNIGAILTNAAKATIKGAELEANIVPSNPLRIDLGIGYLDAKFDDFVTQDPGTLTNPPGGPLPDINLAGRTLPRAPRWTVNAAVGYDIPLGSFGKLNLRGEWRYQDLIYFTQFNRALISQPAFSLFNLRASLTPDSGKFRITAYIQNVGNKLYLTDSTENGIPVGIGVVSPQNQYGPPRTYGMSIAYTF